MDGAIEKKIENARGCKKGQCCNFLTRQRKRLVSRLKILPKSAKAKMINDEELFELANLATKEANIN
jgi:hypothetical protein